MLSPRRAAEAVAGEYRSTRSRSHSTLLWLVALTCAVPLPTLAAQEVAQATFTAEQATAGAELYEARCAACHLRTLQGSFEAPQLAGGNFRNRWGSQPVADLLQRTRETMPPNAPNSLSEAEYTAIIAYIIRENGVAPGEAQLTFATPGLVVAGSGGAAPANGDLHGRLGGARRLGQEGDHGTRPRRPSARRRRSSRSSALSSRRSSKVEAGASACSAAKAA